MDADYSVELSPDDPVLDLPWSDPERRFEYYDLKRHPELLARIPEVQQFPQLGDFLRAVNSTASLFESAKCDVWSTQELNPEEEMFGLPYKFASYVDLVFAHRDRRELFSMHELFAKELVTLLRKTPETASSVEICVRRAYFGIGDAAREGCYLTLYLNGFGDDEQSARLNWEILLKLLANALLQLSSAQKP
jgi:hypothetical protein